MKSTEKKSPFIRILADAVVGISDLKRNPAAVFKAAEGRTMLVLNHSRPAAYIVPTEKWESLMDALRELDKIEEVRDRLWGLGLP